MSRTDIETFCPSNQQEWREWLEKNHESKQSIWLIYYRTSTNIPSLTWSEAVDEALCFGWIDSTKKTIDNERYMQYFTKRKPSSTWSKVNKDKIVKLTEKKLMAKAGLKSIEVAKKNGTWSLMDDVENLIIPKDLAQALSQHKNALDFFQNQSKSKIKGMLHWVVMAKRSATRQKRVDTIVDAIKNQKIPKQFM